MKWITRLGARTDRIACPWLIKKFIDKEAEFLFVPPPEVLATAKRVGGKSFDAPGADYNHRGPLCTFEVMIADHQLADPVLHRLAKIVHGADIEGEEKTTPESSGLVAIANGFAATTPDDHEKLRLQFPVYDALYAFCQAMDRSV